MQLLKQKPKSNNIEDLRDITDDVNEEDFVPYACHWNDNTIVTKNGETLQVIKITGGVSHDLESSEDDSDLRSRVREAIINCVDSTDYAVWIHTIRRKVNHQTEGKYGRDFSGYLNRFWNDSNDWEHQFISEIYITLIRTGDNAKLFDPMIFLRGILPFIEIRRRERTLDQSCEKINSITDSMLALLEGFGAKRLGIAEKDGVYYSELSSFLAKLATLRDDIYPVDEMDISRMITDYDVTFGYNAMEVRMREDGMRRFGAILTLRDYRELPVQYLDRILQTNVEYIISQCFDFVNAKQVLKEYEYQKYLYDTSNAALIAEKTGINDILNHTNKPTDFGLHQITFFVLADTVKQLEKNVSRVVAALTSLGINPLREDIKLEECYWGQMPANFEFIKRLRPLNTARIGGFTHLSHLPIGDRTGNHWGAAVTTLLTAQQSPCFFNFHVGDNGHTMLVGPNVSEKTVVLNFLLSEARKFSPKLIMFDRGRSSEIFVRSLQGAYYNPMPDADKRDYVSIKLNPFSLSNTLENREFLKIFLRMLAGGNNDAVFLAACDTAIEKTMELQGAERVLTSCIKLMGEYSGLFAQWTENGSLAAVFNSYEETAFLKDAIVGFEFSDVLLHPELTPPIVAYLLHRIVQALDGTPTIVVFDEGWTLLAHPYLVKNLPKYGELLRAKNAFFIFTSERVRDVALSPLTAPIVDMVATQLFLPDDDADEFYEKFGLDYKDISYLKAMNNEDRNFLVKQQGKGVVCELNLAGMSDILAVLSATPSHLATMEKMIEEHGITPSSWMPKFLELI